ncbi:MAG TPA: hypothetical protein DCM05_01915 [Elusimicrobia bacterium]|nr:hypothetical protein [Elusimicrobiota bacterium]
MRTQTIAIALALAIPAASAAYAASSAVLKPRKKASSQGASEAAEPSAGSKCLKMTGLSRKRCLTQAKGGYEASSAQSGGQAAVDPLRARFNQKKAGFQAGGGAGASADPAASSGGGAAAQAKGGAAGARAVSGGGGSDASQAALGGIDTARAECMKISILSARASCLEKVSGAARAGGAQAAPADNLVGSQQQGGTLTETQEPIDPNRFKIGTPETGGGHAVR